MSMVTCSTSYPPLPLDITNAFVEKEGNNVETPNGASPGYNRGMGFAPGAQNDIFL